MKCPPDKAGGYTAVVVIITLVLWFATAAVVGSIAGVGSMMAGSTYSSMSDDDARLDEGSGLGKLQKWGKDVEAAGRQLEDAQKSGDRSAQEAAMKTMMGAALGGGAGVESLPPARLKSFVPDQLAGMARSSIAAERNSAMGIQISQANATYSDESGKSVRLEITDAGTAKGLLGLASWAGVEGEQETAGRYEKTFREDGMLIHQEWDSTHSRGQYAVVVGDRFTVKVDGDADSIGELEAAIETLDLDGLEELKTVGVKN